MSVTPASPVVFELSARSLLQAAQNGGAERAHRIKRRKRPKVMKQCGEQWQAAKAAGTTNGETCPEFLKECRARLASTTTAPGRFRSGSCCAGPGPGSCASADAIGLTVPVATACSASPGPCALNLRRAGSNRSRSIRLSAGSSIPLPPSDGGLGQRALAHLPLCGNSRLRQHEAGRLHVRGRRPGCRQSRGEERPPSVRKSSEPQMRRRAPKGAEDWT